MTERRSNRGQQGWTNGHRNTPDGFFRPASLLFPRRKCCYVRRHENVFARIRGADLDFRLCHSLTQRCVLQRGR